MTETTSYFVRRRGRVEGPWALAKLQAEVKLRKLGRHHEVSDDGKTWQRAQTIIELFPPIEHAPYVQLDDDSIEPDAEEELLLEPSAGHDSRTLGPGVWYCAIDNEQRGPYSVGDLASFITANRLSANSLVWREGFNDWRPIATVAELAHLLSQGSRHSSSPLYELGGVPHHATIGRISKLAVIGAVLGVLCLFFSWLPFVGLLGLAPCVISAVAMSRIKSQRLGGNTYAIVGLVAGVCAVLIAILVICLIGATVLMNSPAA